ncbi:secondary thiamine-phosphate synthase enzyme YjbQ [Shewanella sp. C32]|uniref:Secondary thiamine-phosphate synthase enzyme YjbQ n=1 Tax=Shewanella electrica TaxID=515560 RepID=A0ABT2FRX4_9GAMM|nr:secondary thiamine-phosphate synthase enzyme YjbQ [Shewanella electrica]MCH1927045.1 secondary thiamine-phosphate synthase enzyme YjbQ [Shewanella electrica]MCS4557989.1 secondary thiamine-phosphate synthase enzyme YjbQ [Shewanella electrica]
MWQQHMLQLRSRQRGFHLITDEVASALAHMPMVTVGLLHLQLQHTSASLTLNENADPTVRQDFEAWFNHAVSEDTRYFRHTYEGPDDMPAHLKSSLLGTSLMLPISHGRLALGTWQGIYLGEHRDHGGGRKLLLTLQGE